MYRNQANACKLLFNFICTEHRKLKKNAISIAKQNNQCFGLWWNANDDFILEILILCLWED